MDDLEKANARITELEGQLNPLTEERDRLKSHNERLLRSVAKSNERAETAEGERDELKARVPADGTETLNKADSSRWGIVKPLIDQYGGVDKLQARLTWANEQEAEAEREEREAAVSKAGFDLKKLERVLNGASFKVTGEGDDMKVFVIKDDGETPLDEWAETEEVTDLLNVARLEQDTRPPAMPQAGVKRGQQQSTWGQAANDRFTPPKKE